MNVVARIAKNAMSLIMGQGYASVIGLGAIALLSRYLSLEVFGDYGFVIAVCFTFMVITDMGCNQIAIREMARDLDGADDFFSVLLALRLLLAIVTALCIVIAINLMSQSEEVIHAAYIGTAAVVVYILGDVFDDVFKAYERMEFSALLNFVQPTSYMLGILAVVGLDLGLKGIFIALLISYSVRFVTGLVVMRRLFFKARLSWDRKRLGWLFLEALPVGIRRILRKVGFRIDTILLKLLRTRSEVGIFHGAQRIVIVLQFLPRNVTDALFPLFSKHYANNNKGENTVIVKTFRVFLVFALPLTAGLFFLSDQIIVMVLGKKFIEASKLLKLLSFSWLAMFFSLYFNKILVAANRQSLATISVALTTVTNVLLAVVLIPRYGYMGAGVAAVSGEIVCLAVSCYFMNRYVCPISYAAVPKPVFSIVVASAAIYALGGFPVFLRISAGIVSYLLMLFFLQALDREEIEVLLTPFRKGKSAAQGMT